MPGADTHPLEVLDRVAESSASTVGDLKTCLSSDTLRDAVRMIGAANSIAVAGPNQAYALKHAARYLHARSVDVHQRLVLRTMSPYRARND